MKKSKSFILFLAVCSILLLTAMAPAQQENKSYITLDIEGITAEIEKKVGGKYEKIIADLEARVLSLEERIAKLEGALNQMAANPNQPISIPTIPIITPSPTPNPTGYDCKQTVLFPYFFQEFSRGMNFTFKVQIQNTGAKTWDQAVTIKFLDGLKAETENLYAYAMPVQTVAPGESFEINILMIAPTEKTNPDGKYQSVYALNNGEDDFCKFTYSIYVP